MSTRPKGGHRVLVLYTELAPYLMACLERLVADHPVEVHVVRWPVNAEAPFQLDVGADIHLYERSELNDERLLTLCEGLRPDLVLCSGWVDKGYLKVCRALYAVGAATVMCSDTAWRGDLRQYAAIIAAQPWLRRTFGHAWVSGKAQARYAHNLGFDRKRIHTGFYSADVDRFSPLAAALEGSKRERFPHRFLCVARYIPSKGHQLLCDAFAQLQEEGAAGDWELWIAGTGELFEQVTGSASGRHPKVRHLGFVQAGDMPGVMDQCGVFVLPSSYEPWGVVVHEHAAAGFPLLLSDAVGAGERFLEEGTNGHTFAANDREQLIACMRRIVEAGDDRLLEMGRQSARLGTRWDPRAWSATLMTLLRGT